MLTATAASPRRRCCWLPRREVPLTDRGSSSVHWAGQPRQLPRSRQRTLRSDRLGQRPISISDSCPVRRRRAAVAAAASPQHGRQSCPDASLTNSVPAVEGFSCLAVFLPAYGQEKLEKPPSKCCPTPRFGLVALVGQEANVRGGGHKTTLEVEPQPCKVECSHSRSYFWGSLKDPGTGKQPSQSESVSLLGLAGPDAAV